MLLLDTNNNIGVSFFTNFKNHLNGNLKRKGKLHLKSLKSLSKTDGQYWFRQP